MTKLLNTLNKISAVADCVPVVSSIVNGGLLIYQRAHKADQAANPVNKSWKSDFKIFALSKNKQMARASLFPVFGNIAALILKVRRQIQWHSGNPPRTLYKNTLVEAADPRSPMSKHAKEIITLYLAQNPDLPQEELVLALQTASRHGNREAFDILLPHAQDLDSQSIADILAPCASAEIAVTILNKFPDVLSDEDKNMVFKWNLYPRTIEALLPYFDNLAKEDLLTQLTYLAADKDGIQPALMVLDRVKDEATDAEITRSLTGEFINQDTLYGILEQGNIETSLAFTILFANRSLGRHRGEKLERFNRWIISHPDELTADQIAMAQQPIMFNA